MKIGKYILIILVFLAVGVGLILGAKKLFFKPKEIVRAKVAIVLDDWGYNLYTLNFLTEVKAPLTVSVLPNLRYSRQAAEIAVKQGKKVILHLPLEPEINHKENIVLEKNTITTKMSKDEVLNNLRLALSSVPGACGVSNHMGSEATKNSEVMSIIFRELKKRKLFFLDNLVTDKSICRELAQKMKVKFISRDIFLDNSDNYQYIQKQFQKLIDFALVNQEAVGVGHARPATLKVLKERIPLLEAQGIKFVFVSDLVK